MADAQTRFEVSYVLSPVDSGLACLLLYARPRLLLLPVAVLLALFGLVYIVGIISRLGLGGAISAVTDGAILFGIVLPNAALLALLGLLLPVLRALISALAILWSNVAKRSLKLTISDDGLDAIFFSGTSSYRWSAFGRFLKVGDRAFAIFESGQSVVVPRRGLDSDADWQPLLALMQRQIEARPTS